MWLVVKKATSVLTIFFSSVFHQLGRVQRQSRVQSTILPPPRPRHVAISTHTLSFPSLPLYQCSRPDSPCMWNVSRNSNHSQVRLCRSIIERLNKTNSPHELFFSTHQILRVLEISHRNNLGRLIKTNGPITYRTEHNHAMEYLKYPPTTHYYKQQKKHHLSGRL